MYVQAVLVSTKENRFWLKYVKHRNLLDLSVIYITGDADWNRRIVPNNSPIEEPALYRDAMDFLDKVGCFAIDPSMAQRMFWLPEYINPQLWVFTVSNLRYGASVILLPKNLEEIRKSIGEDYYILPSSKHEVIAVPASAFDVEALHSAVGIINKNEIAPEDKLSDSIYLYSDGNLQIVDQEAD